MSQIEWISAAEAVGTCAAALLSVIALIMSLRTARSQMKLSKAIADEQGTLMFEQVRMHRDSDIIAWTGQCIDVLSRGEHWIRASADSAQATASTVESHRDLVCRLSALIDQGRLYFPNATPDKQGTDKPAAYQGFRQRILGVLVSAYNLLAKADRLPEDDQRTRAIAQLNELRRSFVSEAQLTIDPRRYIAMKEMNAIRVSQGIEPQARDERDPAEAFK